MTVQSQRFTPGVTVVYTPRARRIGQLLRAGDLDKAGLLGAITRTGDDRHRR